MLRIDAGQLASAIIVVGGFRLLEQNSLVHAGGCYFAGDRIAADVTRHKCPGPQVVGRRPVSDMSGKSRLRGQDVWTPSLSAFDRNEKKYKKSQLLIIDPSPVSQVDQRTARGFSMVNVLSVSTSGTAGKVAQPSNWHQRNLG